MRTTIEPESWKADLAAFGNRNKMRPTRLEVLGPAREVESDFWLEDGLLLAGIDVDMDRERGPYVEIMLQSSAATTHMTHSVAGVKRLELETTEGGDGSLEIEDQEGMVTIMRFEAEPRAKSQL